MRRPPPPTERSDAAQSRPFAVHGVTRRAVIQAALAAPMLNFGRFRLFARQQAAYSARCLKLMQEPPS